MADKILVPCVVEAGQDLLLSEVFLSPSMAVAYLKNALKEDNPDLLGRFHFREIALYKVSSNLLSQFQ